PIPADSAGAPETGWAAVALALHSALVSGEAVRVAIALPGRAPIEVNTFDHSYTWEQETAELPADASGAQIAFTRAELAAGQPGQSLDGLLWRISRVAFPDRLAPWLQPDDLYRMQRWPNLTTINPELDDMRQAAMLANGMFTVEELAGFSDRPLLPTRALINALSLMNTLKIAAPRAAAAFSIPATPAQVTMPGSAPVMRADAPAVAAPKQGLFQRLRNRLGL
ncbi:MAG: hypothetical protein J0H64_10305, partial [Actinobacteria bacterium]|nr:hypothetical protein [Actinomycetota bacterium]